jgi:hypothetical protein
MQATDGDQGTAGRGRGQRRMLGVALAQGGEEAGDVGFGDLGQVVPSGGGQRADVPAQVTAVRRQGVRGQPALDGQVVEVRRDGARRRRRAQPSASASGVSAMACASATGA